MNIFKNKALHILILSFTLASIFTTVYAKEESSFIDVDIGSEYYEAIEDIHSRGIMNGKTLDTFSPDSNLTFGELYMVMSRIENLELEDVPAGKHWAYSAAKATNKYMPVESIVTGYDGLNTVVPTNVAMTAILRCLGMNTATEFKYLDIDIEEPEQTSVYNDYYVNAYKLGLFNSGEFTETDATITRGQLCIFMSRALKLQADSKLKPVEPSILSGIDYTFTDADAETYISELAYALSLYPDYIIQQMKKDKLEIIVTSEPQSNYTDIKQTASGIYQNSLCRIVLFVHDEMSAFSSIKDAATHEIGHYIYYKLLTSADRLIVNSDYNIASTPKNDYIYNATGRAYYITNEKEFFAEIESAYVLPYKGANLDKCNIDSTVSIIKDVMTSENGYTGIAQINAYQKAPSRA